MQKEYGITRIDLEKLQHHLEEKEKEQELKENGQQQEDNVRDQLVMLGCQDYDILHEEQNADTFVYMQGMPPERENFITTRYEEQSQKICAADLPRIVLDFPYLRREQAAIVDFKPVSLAESSHLKGERRTYVEEQRALIEVRPLSSVSTQ